MSQTDFRIAENYAAVKVDGASPAGAVAEIADGGALFAILEQPPGSAMVAASDAVAAVQDTRTGELALATARLTLRWAQRGPELDAALAAEDARLLRDYGKGGIVEAKSAAAAAAMVTRLSGVEGVTSAEQMILRQRGTR